MRRSFFSLVFCVVSFLFAGGAFADDNGSGGKGGGDGGKGSGENDGGKGEGGKKTEGVYLTVEEYEALKAGGKKKEEKKDGGDGGDDDEELRAKVARQRQAAETAARETKRVEAAIAFNYGLEDFAKKNSDLLPKEIADIIKAGNAETYDSVSAKASAIKSNVVQTFFSVQANLDLLTKGQKETLDDYLKLTKTGKEEKAAQVYENIFEPALETLRKVKKAEDLGRARGGYGTTTDVDQGYKDRLIKGSRKTYLREKEGA